MFGGESELKEQAAELTDGLYIPKALHDVPRTIIDDPSKPSTRRFYDQIAWFQGDGPRRRTSFVCSSELEDI